MPDINIEVALKLRLRRTPPEVQLSSDRRKGLIGRVLDVSSQGRYGGAKMDYLGALRMFVRAVLAGDSLRGSVVEAARRITCQNAPVVGQGCADFSSDSTDRNHSFTPDPRWPSPSSRPGLSFRYTQQVLLTGRAR